MTFAKLMAGDMYFGADYHCSCKFSYRRTNRKYVGNALAVPHQIHVAKALSRSKFE